jgi:uncharacterized protein (TIGR01777 family)
MASILISGGSGLIGKKLSALLISKGHEVKHLGRKENLSAAIKCYSWDLASKKIDERAFEGIDTIVHLAGAGIADKRWTSERKKEILESRIISSELLVNEANKRAGQIKTFVGGSAIGFYGAVTTDKIYTEDDLPGNDFMADVCVKWENTYHQLSAEIKKVIVRTGVVMDTFSGALPKLATPTKLGIGSAIGSGKQIIPWIHIDDIVNLFYEAIVNEKMHGIYNGVSPNPVSNYELNKAIAKQLHKPFFMPNVPKFALNILLGEMAIMVTEGSAISAKKTLSIPFQFNYSEIGGALKNLLGK